MAKELSQTRGAVYQRERVAAMTPEQKRAHLDLTNGWRDKHAHSEDDAVRKAWWAKMNVQRNRKKAAYKGVPFNLVEADIATPDICPVLGTLMIYGRTNFGPNSPSLDRLIPSKGYVRGNVETISHRANLLKNDCTDPDELYRVAVHVADTMSLDDLISAARVF